MTTRTTRSNTPQVNVGIVPLYVRTPAKELTAGVRTFYVPSSEGGELEYVIKHTWRRVGKRGHNTNNLSWVCSCPDWLHRQGPLGRICKHIRIMKAFVENIGGFSKIPPGVTIGPKSLTSRNMR